MKETKIGTRPLKDEARARSSPDSEDLVVDLVRLPSALLNTSIAILSWQGLE